MKKGLFPKVITAYTIIIAVSFIITSGLLSLWFQKYYVDQRENELARAANLVSPSIELYMSGDMTIDMLNNTLKYVDTSFNVDILFVDSYGYVRAGSSDSYDELANKQIIGKDLETLRKGNSVKSEGTYGKTFKVPVYTYIMPLNNKYNGMFEGSIMMNTSMAEIRKPISKVLEIIWILAIICYYSTLFCNLLFFPKDIN